MTRYTKERYSDRAVKERLTKQRETDQDIKERYDKVALKRGLRYMMDMN